MFISPSLTRCWIAGALVFASLHIVSGSPPGADELFSGKELHDIWIHINARDWEQLRTAYKENTYYPADIEWRGIKVRNAGIRVRGRTSRNAEKPGLRVDFNRYVSGQTFLGLKSLALDNLWQDPSMIRERLAMLVFRTMGRPAPRESHARVYIGSGREFAGVYGVVEAIDKDFLERTFGENDGYLYEYHWQEPYGFEFAHPDLEWYAARFEPRTHETGAMATLFSPIRDLVQGINDAPDGWLEKTLQPHLNLRGYITHIAIENFLSQPDGLLGGLGMNNFYLYRPEGTSRSELIPWDQDLAFEWLETPAPSHNIETNRLAAKIWETPELRTLYLQTLVQIAESVGPPRGWLEAEIAAEYAQIRAAALADPRTPHSEEDFEQAIEFLKLFARHRGTIVREHVAQLMPELLARKFSDRPPNRNLQVRRPTQTPNRMSPR